MITECANRHKSIVMLPSEWIFAIKNSRAAFVDQAQDQGIDTTEQYVDHCLRSFLAPHAAENIGKINAANDAMRIAPRPGII
jgi:hypothetical protein